MASSEVTKETNNHFTPRESMHPLLVITSGDENHTFIRFYQLKVAEVICCALACLSFGCGVITYELSYDESIFKEKRDIFIIISISGTVSTIFLTIAIYWRTIIQLRLDQARGVYTADHNLFNTGKIRVFILEFWLNLGHPVYWLGSETFSVYNERYNITIHYTYNSILCFISLIRVYHIIGLISILSEFRSSRAQRLCKMNGISGSTMYVIKCLMKEGPIKAFLVFMFGGILLFAFCLRIFERPISQYTGDPGMDFSDFANAMWCVVLTMTTVGYGDYFPVTQPGRMVGIVACLWGLLFISMMVVTLTNKLSLEREEDKALILLRRLEYKKDLREKAASVLGAAVRFRYMSVRKDTDQKKLKSQAVKFRRYVTNFKETRAQMRCFYDLDSVHDRLERSLNTILEENQKIQERLLTSNERLRTLNSLLAKKA